MKLTEKNGKIDQSTKKMDITNTDICVDWGDIGGIIINYCQERCLRRTLRGCHLKLLSKVQLQIVLLQIFNNNITTKNNCYKNPNHNKTQ